MAMDKIYAQLINKGLKTLEQVPIIIRKQVEEIIINKGAI